MIDRLGRVTALTMSMAIRPWGRVWLPVFLTAARHIPYITAPLRDLAFIRAAHWTIVRAVPDGRGGWQRLEAPQLLFESNFNLDLETYIEKFSATLPWHMRGVWASCFGYRGVIPAAGFHEWVKEHEHKPDHYWCAYPDASTKMVESGLQITERLRAFELAVTNSIDDVRWDQEYQRLLVDVQRYV